MSGIFIRIIVIGFAALMFLRFFKKLRESVGLNQGRMSERKPNQTKADPYEILGVTPSDSWSEIQSAYRSQLTQYHPDKVAHLGEDLKKVAEQKTQDLLWAYEQLEKKFK